MLRERKLHIKRGVTHNKAQIIIQELGGGNITQTNAFNFKDANLI